MSELTDFLLARIAEDEAAARAATRGPWEAWRRHDPTSVTGDTFGICSEWAGDVDDDVLSDSGLLPVDAEHIARHDPARVLAECEAKRAIVAAHPSYDGRDESCWTCADTAEDLTPWPCPTVRATASVYADHPDYRDEWKS